MSSETAIIRNGYIIGAQYVVVQPGATIVPTPPARPPARRLVAGGVQRALAHNEVLNVTASRPV